MTASICLDPETALSALRPSLEELLKRTQLLPIGIRDCRVVDIGSTVTWTNEDDEPHTVVSDDKLFRSSSLDTYESFRFTFEKTGTYHFTCSIHPRVVGTIVVQ